MSFGSRLLFVVGSFKAANPSCRAIAGPTGGGYSVIYRCMSLDVGCSLTLWLPNIITGCGCPTRLLWELECRVFWVAVAKSAEKRQTKTDKDGPSNYVVSKCSIVFRSPPGQAHAIQWVIKQEGARPSPAQPSSA